MGDPVTAGLIAGGSIAGQTFLQGRQQRSAAKMQAAQLRTEEKAIETNAALEQAERMNQLKAILAAQNAIFAMGGQSAGVGSAAAKQMASLSNANRERRISKLKTDVAKSGYDYNIWSAKKAASTAMANAIFSNALSTGARVGEAYTIGSFKETTGLLVVCDLGNNCTLCSDSGGLLLSLSHTLLTKPSLSLLDITFALDKCLLAVHDAAICELTEFFYLLCCNCHIYSPLRF